MKIAIGIPMYKQVPTQAVTSIMGLQRHLHIKDLFADKFDDYEIITIDSCFVDTARNMIVDEAIKKKCDYILWIDSDHQFDVIELENFVRKAMFSEFDIVGGWYNSRTEPGQVVAYNFNEEISIPIMTKINPELVKKEEKYLECGCPGLGMCLMPTTIPSLIREKHSFAFRCENIDGNIIGEDTYFFFKVMKENKYTVAIDCSFHVGHIGGII